MTEKTRHHLFDLIKTHINTIVLSAFLIVSVSMAFGTYVILNKDSHYEMTVESSVKDKVTTISSEITTTATNKTITSTTTTSVKITTSRKTSTNTVKSVEPAAQFPIDVNFVSYDELMQIDGIGEVLAGNIIDFKNSVGKITNMDQLLEVDGIGEGKLETLKKYLYVSDEDYRQITNVEMSTTQSRLSNVTSTNNEKMLRSVNVNTASAEEISECLDIDIEISRQIVDLRNEIEGFTATAELLYVDGFTDDMYNKLKEYILI